MSEYTFLSLIFYFFNSVFFSFCICLIKKDNGNVGYIYILQNGFDIDKKY